MNGGWAFIILVNSIAIIFIACMVGTIRDEIEAAKKRGYFIKDVPKK